MRKFLVAGMFSLLLTVSVIAPVSAADKTTKQDQKTVRQEEKNAKKCSEVQEKLQDPGLQKPKNKDRLVELQAKALEYCPTPSTVTISADGCTVTAQGPVGAVITYGAHTPDNLRGWDAQPVTITDASTVFTGYTGAASGLDAYVTITQNGKVLATKTSTVTVSLCTAGQPNGGYPSIWANAAQDSLIDNWGMYNREGVSYVAFKVHEDYLNGKDSHDMPWWGGIGNANQWDDNAIAAGIPVDTTAGVGEVAIFNGGLYGQAYYVEAVNSDGTIDVSTYNQNFTGQYSYISHLSKTNLVFIHF